MQVPTCVERFRRYARGARGAERHRAAAERDADDRARARRPHGRDRRSPAGRRRRLHHAVQLSDRQHGGQDRPGAGHGQHRRGQAGAAGSAGRHPRVRVGATKRASRPGVVNVVDRIGRRGRRGAGRVEARRHGQLHGIDGCGSAHRRGRRSRHEAAAARARAARARPSCSTTPICGRRSRRSSACGRSTPVRSARRRRGCSRSAACTTSSSRDSQAAAGIAEGRRPAREGHGARPGHLGRAPRSCRVVCRAPAPTKEARSSPAATAPTSTTGFYVAPTLIADCKAGMKVVQEEIFGPVVVVVPFDDEDEGVALANGTDFGLYDYVFSADTARAMRVAKQLRSGNVGINTAQRNHEAPVRRLQAVRRRPRRRLASASTPTRSSRPSSGPDDRVPPSFLRSIRPPRGPSGTQFREVPPEFSCRTRSRCRRRRLCSRVGRGRGARRSRPRRDGAMGPSPAGRYGPRSPDGTLRPPR